MGLFFNTKKGSIISTVDLPTTEIIEPKIIETQSKTIEMMANELTLLREQVEYLRQKLYGKSSEKVVHQPGQLSLFGEESLPEEEADLPS